MLQRFAIPLSLLLVLSACGPSNNNVEKNMRAEDEGTYPPHVKPPPEKFRVHDNYASVWVRVWAPMPEEVEDDTQAKALSREAAITIGQDVLMTYVLKQKTRSKQTLSEAQIPSVETQEAVKTLVKGAQVASTTWHKDRCYVTIGINRSQLNAILRKI